MKEEPFNRLYKNSFNSFARQKHHREGHPRKVFTTYVTKEFRSLLYKELLKFNKKRTLY